MQTSNFTTNSIVHFKNPVGIAGRSQKSYSGREYKILAPKYWFFKKYKEDRDRKFFIEKFNEEVLGELDAKTVYRELGEDATLLCWEKPGYFCHRHLVAEWLMKELNIEILEYVMKSSDFK